MVRTCFKSTSFFMNNACIKMDIVIKYTGTLLYYKRGVCLMEHMIMRNIVHIASSARRRLKPEREGDCRKFRGFGHILDLLAEQNGLTQQQIAAALDIRPQSASEAVAGMEQQGLVERRTNEQDKRSSLVYITEKGVERQAQLRDERIQNAKRILEPLTEQEKEILLGLLKKITSALQKDKEES